MKRGCRRQGSFALACALAGAVACSKSAPQTTPPVAEAGTTAAPAPSGIPSVTTDNKNVLVTRSGSQITASASSIYDGRWPARNAIDGDLKSSWYSARDDAAAHGKAPFLALTFATPATVSRVTILG